MNTAIALIAALGLATSTGNFSARMTVNNNHEFEPLYRFNGDGIVWEMTEEEIGFIPSPLETYRLIYDENGTTKENSDPELYYYDDKVVTVYPISK